MGRLKKYKTKEEKLERNRLASKLWYEKNKHKPPTAKCSFQYEEFNNIRNHIGGTYCQYHYNIMSKASNYNISPLEVLEMQKKSTCEICENYMDKKCIDHNHDTGKVRGLICHSCNVIIGLAKENTETLKKIIKYINYYEK